MIQRAGVLNSETLLAIGLIGLRFGLSLPRELTELKTKEHSKLCHVKKIKNNILNQNFKKVKSDNVYSSLSKDKIESKHPNNLNIFC